MFEWKYKRKEKVKCVQVNRNFFNYFPMRIDKRVWRDVRRTNKTLKEKKTERKKARFSSFLQFVLHKLTIFITKSVLKNSNMHKKKISLKKKKIKNQEKEKKKQTEKRTTTRESKFYKVCTEILRM